MRFIHRRLSLAIALLGVNMPLYAVDLGSDVFSLSGFGSIGVVHSNYDQGDFRTDGAVPKGSGRSTSWSFSQMTKAGIQLDAKANDSWSASVQAVSEYSYDGDYSPEFKNIFVKFQATPNLAFRAGRMVEPIYMLTDYARVGYALPWARPPLEMYSNYPTYDGIDTIYKFNAANIAWTTQALAGVGSYKTASSPGGTVTEIESKQTLGLSVLADVGAWTFRAAHIQSKSDVHNTQFDQIFAAYRARATLIPSAGVLADEYNPNGKTGFYDTVGVNYDPGKWFVRAEMAKVTWNKNTILPSSTSGYLTGGYRFGAFTPYAIYGWAKQDSPTTLGSADPLTAINSIMAGSDGSRHSWSLGMRWDFKQNMDMKVQFSRIEKDSTTSSNGLTYRVSGSTVPESYNVLFAGIDFVF